MVVQDHRESFGGKMSSLSEHGRVIRAVAYAGRMGNVRLERSTECSEKGRPQHERPLPKGRGKMTRPQMVLVCQSADTRLAGEDGDHVGTMKLSEKELHRILTK